VTQAIHSASQSTFSRPFPIRASQALRQILACNPDVRHFTIETVLAALGDKTPGNTLLFFSIPGLVPIPDIVDLAGFSTVAIGSQMMAGRTAIRLPKSLLKRSVPRRSLAVAIHTILPILEKAEKFAKPRLQWATRPLARRLLGFVVFLAALTLAFPFLGYDMLHSATLLIISMGLIEKDGLAVLIGVTAAIASLLLVTGLRFSGKVFFMKAWAWIKTAAVRLGLNWLAAALKKRGLKWAQLLELKWAELLLLWNPEARQTHSAKPENAANSQVCKTTRAHLDRDVLTGPRLKAT